MPLDTTKKPDFVHQTFIRCTRDALWDALTDPSTMSAYHFLCSDIARDGDTYVYKHGDGSLMLTCRTLEEVPKSKIIATFEPHWEGGGAPSTTIFLIDEEAGHCRLTVEHYDLTFPVVQGEGVADGWTRWAAGLKTWLETGEATRFNGGGSA